ncbi:hypothetical protein EDB87DRAFT_143560 [Lactarius vividus]|nr:hypothetical protein EDB87DRAFT_143560 [Lactarius vividus]
MILQLLWWVLAFVAKSKRSSRRSSAISRTRFVSLSPYWYLMLDLRICSLTSARLNLASTADKWYVHLGASAEAGRCCYSYVLDTGKPSAKGDLEL